MFDELFQELVRRIVKDQITALQTRVAELEAEIAALKAQQPEPVTLTGEQIDRCVHEYVTYNARTIYEAIEDEICDKIDDKLGDLDIEDQVNDALRNATLSISI